MTEEAENLRQYSRFNYGEIQKMEKFYEKIQYPTKQQYHQLAKELKQNQKKIETWFKHYRQSQYNLGLFPQQAKKWFIGDNLKFLEERFKQTPLPTHQQYLDYVEKVNSNLKHVKNWFANKRRKQEIKKTIKKRSNINNNKNQSNLIIDPSQHNTKPKTSNIKVSTETSNKDAPNEITSKLPIQQNNNYQINYQQNIFSNNQFVNQLQSELQTQQYNQYLIAQQNYQQLVATNWLIGQYEQNKLAMNQLFLQQFQRNRNYY